MTAHAVVIAGAGPTGLMLTGELALVGVDVAIVERRTSHDLPGSRAGGLRHRVGVEHTLAHLGRWQGDRARCLDERKNLFDLRRVAVVHNLHVLDRAA